MRRFPPAFDLVPDQVAQVIQLAGLAPSPHNSQPWRFRVLPHVIEVHADRFGWLADVDLTDRELRMACGAALMNLRLALAHAGVQPVVTLLPRLAGPTVVAEVRSGGHQRPEAEQIALVEAISDRRTHRRPFHPTAVSVECRRGLVQAARAENAWLHLIQPSERGALERLVHRARLTRLGDGGNELAAWTGSPADAESEATAEFDPNPLLAVLGMLRSSPEDELRAGQALQRVWLTATARGLVAATPPEMAAVPDIRDDLRRLLGGSIQPHALLRIGYGAPSPAAPRRDPGELLIDAFPASNRT
ncbi:nitroreductase [Saccharopolyspora sp. K220]|uniref:nitroreductase n=1 Tax=Saccharopolyspora soli TaxID=2926618 RepID=UPI001F564DB7|nr:nitroreductase [Saccharopolyspora soli]MCI2421768.1 nitroreductase [Saccharopolyspora soli]